MKGEARLFWNIRRIKEVREREERKGSKYKKNLLHRFLSQYFSESCTKRLLNRVS